MPSSRRFSPPMALPGKSSSSLEDRLGRRINPKLADLGRLLWFDNAHSLHQDNTCAGCHSPTNGFGDTQTIAIGVDNNGIVGPRRTGARNQRRSPLVVNTAFLPRADVERAVQRAVGRSVRQLGRASCFRRLKGRRRSRRNDPVVKHLLQAQAHIPPTELVEVAGFTGTRGTDRAALRSVRQPPGSARYRCPMSRGFRNEPIRQKVLRILNAIPEYRKLFGEIFPSVRRGEPIDFTMFGQAIAEFEFTLTFADAPDRSVRARSSERDEHRPRSAARCCSSARPAASRATPSPATRTRCSATSRTT